MRYEEFLDNLPPRHRLVIEDLSDPAHECCDFLVWKSPYELLQLRSVNASLHSSEYFNQWPWFLVAFASNGCADYFAYDLRTQNPSIIYIDPDHTVWENLNSDDQLTYDSFSEWYELTIAPKASTKPHGA